MTDGELLDRFVTDRDEAAFESLIRRHGPMVHGLCRRALRDEYEADDAFQATFLVLVRNARSIRRRDSLGSWLYGVAHRVALKAKVEATRRARVQPGEPMPSTGPEAESEHRELRPALHEEVGRLPEKYRAPIVLCYFEGRSHEEAARQLDWPIGTVKGRLARAREVLQSRLVRRGLALSLGLVTLLDREATAEVPEHLVEATLRSARVAVTAALATADPAGSADAPAPLRPRSRLRLRFGLALLGLLGGGRWLATLSASDHPPPWIAPFGRPIAWLWPGDDAGPNGASAASHCRDDR